MLKTDYPIYFDTTELSIKHRSWNRSIEPVYNLNQTEAGTDDVEYLRLGKNAWSGTWRVTDEWAATLAGFANKPSFTLKTYDVETKAYKEYTVRVESFSANEVRRSDISRTSNGIYDVSMSIVEF